MSYWNDIFRHVLKSDCVDVGELKMEDESMNEMPKRETWIPEIKPGMVIGADGLIGYATVYRVGQWCVYGIDMTGRDLTIPKETIKRICVWGDYKYNSYPGKLDLVYYTIWKRPQLKEMTVAEISKELGYPVKIVE